MAKYILSLLVSITFLYSCQKNELDVMPPNPTTPTSIAASTQSNVPYGTDTRQKMDVYLPANRTTTTTKVMIVIHGGAWQIGDKADMSSYVDTLKTRLPIYAFFNMNYRLYNGSTNFFPSQEQDVKACVEFIFNNRATYLISDKIVLLGASAGAHLALLQAYKNASPQIKAVVSLYAPSDMADMYNNPASIFAPADSIAKIVTGSIGGTPATQPTKYFISSPINYVTPSAPPTILFHGGADLVVRASQSATLNTKLAANNVTRQYVLYPAEGHAYLGPSLNDTFNKTIAFLNLYVL